MWNRIKRSFVGKKGVAITEMAVMAPMLLLLSLGTYDVANSISASIRLERAVQAGAQHALANSSDLNAIRQTVISAGEGLSTTSVPMPVMSCECANVVRTCSSSCPSGMKRMLEIRATTTLSPVLLRSQTQGVGHVMVRIS